jgi:drug/metabolite transporter (DMT)-like permease
MSLIVFALVTASAALHVLWNALVKTCRDKVSFALLTCLASLLFVLPLGLLLEGRACFAQPAAFWGMASLSGFFESLYTIFLFKAYRYSDLSVVYPLSRGVAPVFTMTFGGLLIGDALPAAHALLVGVILVGIIGVVTSTTPLKRAELDRTGTLFALATGATIAGYHLVDRKVMMAVQAPSPLLYLLAMHIFLALFISVYVLIFGRGRHPVALEWRSNRRGVLIVGACTPLAYLLIMVALQFGNVTHVAAGRNIGILFSTLVGSFFLKERITLPRAVGAVLIAGGVAGLVFF